MMTSATPSDSIIKSSVHTSTGINRSLLTPYRRIGLSRKSKPIHKIFNTPLQETQSTEGAVTNLQQKKDNLYSVSDSEECTVSQAKEFPSLRKVEEIKAIDSLKIQNRKHHAKGVSTKPTTEATNSKIACKVINKKSESIEWLDHLQKMVGEEEQKQTSNTYTPLEISLDNLEQLQSKELKVHITRMDHSIKRKSVSTTSHRKVKRKLSMKKISNSCDVDSCDTDDEVGLFKSDIVPDNASLEDAAASATSNDISLQQLAEAEGDEKEDTSSLIDEILQLEKQVHEKEVHLSKLQQAEVYHNMHKVEDLDKLTNIWKSKCQEVLRDLLEKLKEHALLDMPTLLKNLNVPSSLIDYNCEDDIFV